MTISEKYIVETYSHLFDGLNSISKMELLEKLAKSLKRERKSRNNEFISPLDFLVLGNQPKKLQKKLKKVENLNKKN